MESFCKQKLGSQKLLLLIKEKPDNLQLMNLTVFGKMQESGLIPIVPLICTLTVLFFLSQLSQR